MAGNDSVILNQILAERQIEIHSTPEDEVFELFTAEQVLKDFDLSSDEINTGLVGGGGNGGVDGIYLLVNGELIQEDSDYHHFKMKNIILNLIIIQAKTKASFEETPVERFTSFSEDLLNLDLDIKAVEKNYNQQLVEAINRFHMLYKQLSTQFPQLCISYFYSSKGANVSKSIESKVNKLKKVVERNFSSCEFKFEFLSASRLLALARRKPQTTYQLTLAETPISPDGLVGFVCLVKLHDFFKFIADENKNLRRNIFEGNVRDYQGKIEVNKAIQKSLQQPLAEDFWWLNNGVSILASEASLGGKILTIKDPQIVNGLQTSTEIYHYFNKYNAKDDNRKILVRVVVPDETESRDRIIKATNSQTVVQQASLRATDKIHQNIEEYLLSKGLFYDRRKNYYKNEGKPRDKVVGISELAQSITSIVLQRPDIARARPSSLLKKDTDYASVYSEKYPINLYYVCAEAKRRVDLFLKVELELKDRNNLRFYILMYSVFSLIGKSKSSIDELAHLDVTKLNDTKLKMSLDIVKKEYANLGGSDQVAKGRQLLSNIQQHLGAHQKIASF